MRKISRAGQSLDVAGLGLPACHFQNYLACFGQHYLAYSSSMDQLAQLPEADRKLALERFRIIQPH